MIHKEQFMSRSFGPIVALAVVSTISFGAQAPLKTAPPGGGPPAGGPAANGSKATVVRLAVDPAAEPRPALKYSFVTRFSERKPGNAAPFYYRAILAYTVDSAAVDSKGHPSLDSRLDEWSRAPLKSFPRDEVRKVVGFRAFEDLREAASREECNWDWRLQDTEGPKSFYFLLDEVQRSRSLARWLAVKARLEIAEGRYDDAVETLRIGYQFARDIGKSQILICGLVGIAITAILDDQAHTFIGAPGSPNLYWAFTELPRPLIDLRPAVEFEVTFPSRVFPFLKDPEHALHSPEQWAELVSRAMQTLTNLMGSQPADTPYWQARLAATGLALRGYTQAKRALIAEGYDAAKVEQMPVGQVIALDEVRISRYVADESRKWSLVPYAEGWRRQKQVDAELIRNHYLGPPMSTREVLPINSLLLPATSSATNAMIRRDISIAANQAIEAIRMHAAQHGGKLPQSLSEISVVPVPNHPRFGTPFPYKLEGDKAILEVRRMTEAPEPMQDSDYIFEITIARND
jgi:hypothetical protein